MIRVADYIAWFIAERLHLEHVFLVSGAGIMHLTDGIAANAKLHAVCLHHEQSAAMALEAYARTNGRFGVGCFTTGPGATNAITGLVGAWQDSVPCLFLSGQVKRAATSRLAGVPGLRQFGVQELDIVPIVASVSKHAVLLIDPARVRWELEKAVHIARSGRPGPVWIDIPMDVQAAWIDPDALEGFSPNPAAPDTGTASPVAEAALVLDLIRRAERPVIIAGQGVRLVGAGDALRRLAERHRIPVVTPYLGIDTLRHDLEVYIGKPGVRGDRAANYTMQNADLVLALGTSLAVSVVGYDYGQFARAATKVVVDIDPTAHRKATIAIDHLIVADARMLLDHLLLRAAGDGAEAPSASPWLDQCTDWKRRYPAEPPDHSGLAGGVHSHGFTAALSRMAGDGDVFVCDTGTAMYALAQAIHLTGEGQRFITSGGMACMGYTLPAAIGASLALGG